jgi:predicted Zn finger-like uncharacterized protein
MIIQCRQCRTKFRFDDSLMEGDGVWMRCSHCQHVFFQDNPQVLKSGGQPLIGSEAGAEGTTHTRAADIPTGEASIAGNDEDVTLFLDNVMKAKKSLDEESMPDIEKPVSGEIPDADGIDSDRLPAEEDEAQHKKVKSPRRGLEKVLKVALWSIFVIVAVPAIVYLYVLPQIGDRLIKIAGKYVDIGFLQPVRPEIVVGQIKLQDIRQRILNSYILGPIRIVEGTAVNQADYPISRIMIKGEIVDAYSVILAERVSYAGNILTDEELLSMPEEQILKKLYQPEGRNNSNDKIIQGGQIPFMIVFAREPAGVIKTTVMAVGAERLL